MAELEALEWIKKYHRLTNYLGASMLYLKDNYFLEEDLQADHIKNRILGHWGTVPGLNLMYAGVNYLVSKTGQETMFIAGPGHGAPAVLANLFVEGTLGEYYPEALANKSGFEYLIKHFSWPKGFPSHTYPGVPGTIMEGGELGYSLGTAYGTVLDNPNLLTVVAVGDGEAETGPLAASWHSNKFINPETSGAVLPILHLNGYRISGPTIFGTMTNEEIFKYFEGLGYHPHILDQYTSKDIYDDYLNTIDYAHKQILEVKENWKTSRAKPRWPIIILRSMKGWTAPEFVEGRKIEDHNNSHGIPLEHPKKDDIERKAIQDWLRSYDIHDLLNEDKTIKEDVLKFVPKGEKRLGKVKYAYGGDIKQDLELPDLSKLCMDFEERGFEPESSMQHMGEYFKQLLSNPKNSSNFRIFSPDESESNKLGKIFDVTSRQYVWPVRNCDECILPDGKVMEILSEHVLQEWMQGYTLTGRHGILISYEAFLGIVTTMIDQFIKYLKSSQDIPWRSPLPSLNYVATSTGWRQDHNGFSHQNPSLINTLLSKHADFVSIYFPADVNTLLASMDDCFNRVDNVNLIVSGKRELPQWLSINEAREHVKRGISIWEWAGNKTKNEVDVVLASCGDYQTVETIAAAQILKEDLPELSFQYVNVNELTRLGLGDENNPILSSNDYKQYFTDDKDVIFNFHGYPEAIKQITWGRRISEQMVLLGYIEEGTTTTPFDMQVLNKASRYHVCIQAILSASRFNPAVKEKEEELIRKYSDILEKHSKYIVENGDDMPEIKNFKFKF
ncbi:phosphoketolase family protein [Candidatus Dojkabacteria bacterium]|uniref:Phosphoketolase family protein n=1 Tax=Candidatus Dojkabacteria bacterium TaxID=2099670 RepID=A0A955RGP9_9BACT|nr:phosphoketolase family protein [Candidatus Dojkabacteria bacterium]